ncbi:MAG: hypothetical protein A2015_10040 [Spirochaetes bacterium GWF1_31_7]|nr:MAG: hypothetical protein A2Y30_16375 [Spirochaetes bacterium GWE1_32_154]OHD48551.1 MAG: hypothetical protein A2Y29_14350 [Spirochaetes bacterium GWE2_31_10]OHD52179.1 MAG: hypothetical protein A2015_10040 [Spirochaetes bacterium GWF1_31_7]OHD82906.1 MAG: hypothetical protein A2355_07615 [Spirochaetes bacterium RIFOXYB1_FULL_32_8]HBD93314.1 hypothetical protein [Spirochaetia bacterium]
MSQSKRRNYLIDKPFQLGFIVKYLIVILITVIFCFGVTAVYFYYDNLFGDNKLNETVIIKYNGPVKTNSEGKNLVKNGKYFLYDNQELKITVFKTELLGEKEYQVFRPFSGNEDEQYLQGRIISLTDSQIKDLVITTGPQEKITQQFFIVIYPLVYTSFMIMLIITLYSLFFSHRMAGPVYRMRISLDRMLAGDYDFKIRVRRNDFFRNIVEKLEQLRIKQKSEKPSKE